LTAIVSIIGGLILLALGAEGLVRGSASVALRLGIAPLVVGLTIVAFGTGSPELVVSISAALEGNSPIALGNVVGSNVLNILAVLGLTALIQPISAGEIRALDMGAMLGTAGLLFVLLGRNFRLDRIEGTLLLIGYVIYIYTLLPQ
jgi:cation:H+ antiporter